MAYKTTIHYVVKYREISRIRVLKVKYKIVLPTCILNYEGVSMIWRGNKKETCELQNDDKEIMNYSNKEDYHSLRDLVNILMILFLPQTIHNFANTL